MRPFCQWTEADGNENACKAQVNRKILAKTKVDDFGPKDVHQDSSEG